MVDIVWTEEGNSVGIMAEGVLFLRIRTYKTAARCGKRVFTYAARPTSGGAPGPKIARTLAMAESIEFDRQCMGMVGLVEDLRDYISF